MNGDLQSVLCARLLLRLRGAYKEADAVTQLSTWSARTGPSPSAVEYFGSESIALDARVSGDHSFAVVMCPPSDAERTVDWIPNSSVIEREQKA